MLFLHQYLWIASNLLLWLCLVFFVYRRHQERYPILAAYFAIESFLFLPTAATNVLFSRHLMSLNTFQWGAVIGTGISSILELAVLYELANTLVLSRTSLTPILQGLLRWCAAILLLAATVVSALLGQPGLHRVMAAFQTLDFSSNVIEIGLLIVMLLFTRALRVSWGSLPAGIVLGFAVSASTEIACAALLSVLDRHQYTQIDSLRLLGFHICVVIWLVYILLPQDSAATYTGNVKIADLELWNEEMQNIRD